MVTLTLMGQQPARRQGGGVASATRWFPAGTALGVAGLATASSAITCLAIFQSSSDSDPPPAVDDSSSRRYLLALSGLFYAGVAEVGAAVWVMAEPRARAAAGRRLVHASLVSLTAAVGLLAAAATLFW